jgi:hypothetical protein
MTRLMRLQFKIVYGKAGKMQLQMLSPGFLILCKFNVALRLNHSGYMRSSIPMPLFSLLRICLSSMLFPVLMNKDILYNRE